MGDWTPRELRFSNLGLRLMSSAILIPLGLAAVWSGGWGLALACAATAGVMAWEWGHISGYTRTSGLIVFAVLTCFSLPLGMPSITVAVMVAGLIFAAIGAKGGWNHRGSAVFGLLYVTLLPMSLWLLRDGPWDGRAAALYFMSFVWASDAAAYFTGRGLGGPRLLPKESPNKTWSGAIGAVIACIGCGVAAADIERVSFLPWIFAGMAISIVAQAGDLFESGLKRRFRVKDSGTILPGHGGVMDRVDGLGAVSFVTVLLFHTVPKLPEMLGL